MKDQINKKGETFCSYKAIMVLTNSRIKSKVEYKTTNPIRCKIIRLGVSCVTAPKFWI